MKTTQILLLPLLAVLASACGDDLAPRETLVGTWRSPVDDRCAIDYAFSHDGLYSVSLTCGKEGFVEKGTYGTLEGRVYIRPTETSCLDFSWPVSFGYELNGLTLRTFEKGGELVLRKAKASAVPVSVGCFTDEGVFVAAEMKGIK